MMPAANDRPHATVDEPPEIGLLFHRLNNQLGIILANAELLEAKSGDDMSRARAAQVVASVLDAMTTAREIRLRSRAPRSSGV
jgi:hypothetical protein